MLKKYYHTMHTLILFPYERTVNTKVLQPFAKQKLGYMYTKFSQHCFWTDISNPSLMYRYTITTKSPYDTPCFQWESYMPAIVKR